MKALELQYKSTFSLETLHFNGWGAQTLRLTGNGYIWEEIHQKMHFKEHCAHYQPSHEGRETSAGIFFSPSFPSIMNVFICHMRKKISLRGVTLAESCSFNFSFEKRKLMQKAAYLFACLLLICLWNMEVWRINHLRGECLHAKGRIVHSTGALPVSLGSQMRTNRPPLYSPVGALRWPGPASWPHYFWVGLGGPAGVTGLDLILS